MALNDAELKTCTKCERTLSTDLFGTNRAAFDGKNCVCKKCHNTRSNLWKKTNTKRVQKRANAIRGLLCGHCNKMLGMAKDDISRLEAGICYLGGGK